MSINAIKRVRQTRKQLNEAAYAGNIGIMELIKFKQKATAEQKKKFDELLGKKKNREVWDLVQQVTGVQLHKSVHEEVKPDILPKSGGGQDGTSTLVKSYMKDTPGQDFKKFRQYIKNKY